MFFNVIVMENTTIRQAMRVLNTASLRIVLVCDEDNNLKGIVTDGDLRRALLEDANMEDCITKVMNRNPICAKSTDSRLARLRIMKKHDFLSIPIVDENNKVVGIDTLQKALQPEQRDNPVLIMAGGFGTRLQPLTDYCPKPMLKVGDKPMLEHLINQFVSFGFHNFYISTHFMPEQIINYFGDGQKFGVRITYVHEEQPLGTGGALGLLPEAPSLPLIVMNGDVLAKVDFEGMLEYHKRHKLDATMCVREFEYKVPFGVIEVQDDIISSMIEKPTYRYRVNTGIYILSPECVKAVKPNQRIDLPSLLELRMQQRQRVGTYTLYDYWLDIGRMDDYQKSQKDIKQYFDFG